MNKPYFVYLMVSAFSLLPGFAAADGGYLRTAVPLDEPRGYCLDVAGFGSNARTEEPLRLHTCKYGEDNADQLFEWVDFDSGHIRMPAYERCLSAASLDAGAKLYVTECKESELQSWVFVPNGNLVLKTNPDLCLTAGDERFEAGAEILVSPGYQYRNSTLQACRERGDPLQDFRWGRDDEHVRGMANALRAGMPEAVQNGIRALHEDADASGPAQTAALYQNVRKNYRSGEVKTTADVAYGEHERHKLDVHVDTRRRGDDLQPVVIYFHGGGYVRGNKKDSRNVGEYFASIGLVGISATYRLAPEIRWPEGANDVGAVVAWANKNIRDYGGDPQRVYLIGKSAGGGHVATYAFRPDMLDQPYPRAAGIVLLSAGLTETANAYFSVANDTTDQGILGNVNTRDLDVLLATAEYDPPSFSTAAISLADELVTKHNYVPRLRQLPGHNHFSSNTSIGTEDRLLSNEILDFVLRNRK